MMKPWRQRTLQRAMRRRRAVQPVRETVRGRHQAATSSRRRGDARRRGRFPPASRDRAQHLRRRQGASRLTRQWRRQLQLWLRHMQSQALQRQTRCMLCKHLAYMPNLASAFTLCISTCGHWDHFNMSSRLRIAGHHPAMDVRLQAAGAAA
jgi:hypothetical protein